MLNIKYGREITQKCSTAASSVETNWKDMPDDESEITNNKAYRLQINLGIFFFMYDSLSYI